MDIFLTHEIYYLDENNNYTSVVVGLHGEQAYTIDGNTDWTCVDGIWLYRGSIYVKPGHEIGRVLYFSI